MITQEHFDVALDRLLSTMPADKLLSIPGIYEILSEEFHDKVIDIINFGGTTT